MGRGSSGSAVSVSPPFMVARSQDLWWFTIPRRPAGMFVVLAPLVVSSVTGASPAYRPYYLLSREVTWLVLLSLSLNGCCFTTKVDS